MPKQRSLEELKAKTKEYTDCIKTYSITRNLFFRRDNDFWGSQPIKPMSGREIEDAFAKNNAHKIANCVINTAHQLTQLGEFKKAEKLIDDALETSIVHDHCGARLPSVGEFFKAGKNVIKHHNKNAIKESLHLLHVNEAPSPYALLIDCKSQINDIKLERGITKPVEIELEEERAKKLAANNNRSIEADVEQERRSAFTNS